MGSGNLAALVALAAGDQKMATISLRWVSSEWYLSIALDSSYASALAVQQLPQPHWDSDTNEWLIPYSPLALHHALTLWPEAVLDDKLAAVRLRLGLAMRDMACPGTSSPDLPEGLYEHQRSGAAWLRKKGSALLCDEVGLGKTRTAIAAVSQWLPTLIVCTASVAYFWAAEIQALTGQKTHIIEHRSRGIGSAAWSIISYDLLRYHQHALLQRYFSSAVFDEIQHVRNLEAKRTRAALAIATRVPHTLGLSATPLLSCPANLLGPLIAVQQIGWAEQFYFLKEYCGPSRGWGSKRGRRQLSYRGATNQARLREFLQTCMLRRTQADAGITLPQPNYIVLTVEPSNLALYLHEQTLTKGWLSSVGVSAPFASKLLRINNLRRLSALGKTTAIRANIQNCLDAGHRVLVFCSFLDPLAQLRAEWPESLYLDGATSPRERARLVERFQDDPTARMMLLSTEAGGEGITLSAASIIFCLDYPWLPATLTQCVGRAHRLGQRYELHVYLVSGKQTVDEIMLQTLITKAKVVEALLGEHAAQAAVLDAVESYLLAA